MTRVWIALVVGYSIMYGSDVSGGLGLIGWNGSGIHSNFSTTYTREMGGEAYINSLLEGFATHHTKHMAEYGAHNEERMTGGHETASFEKFSFGVSDRGASIRISIYTIEHGWKGYLEDRRPASNADS